MAVQFTASRKAQPRQHFDVPFSPVSPLLQSQDYRSNRTPGTISAVSSLQSLRNPLRHDAYTVNYSHLVSPIMSRSNSVASNDRFSVVSGLTSNTHFASNPQNVNPAPAYVAPFGAVQVVSEHQAARARRTDSDDEDSSPDKDDVQFSPAALALVNAFLDQLLYSFLSTARSTSLAALRPAVTEVLRHRLAKDAIASAEDELKELLAGNEEEEETDTKQNAADNNRRWDLELVWKRTRLRVMVYMRLGEMEDDDEERYVKEEELFHGSERRFSQSTGLVSWAAAIFLTSVLEYIAEQTLQVAGQAAYNRVRRQSRSVRLVSPSDAKVPVLVEDYDVEKVALNSSLGRLWRTWRKSLRNNVAPPFEARRGSFSESSRENLHSAYSTRRGSLGAAPEGLINEDGSQTHPHGLDNVPEMEYPEHVLASNIPLPIGDRKRDVDEIEVPGLAKDPDAQEETAEGMPLARRNSFTKAQVSNARPTFHRQRSSSVPTPGRRSVLMDIRRYITPGAFPEEPPAEEQPESRDPVEEEYEPDHKFNALEMASHKRSTHDVKQLLDKVADPAPAENKTSDEGKGEHHNLISDAIAGAAAAAAATAAMFYGSKEKKEDDAKHNQPEEPSEQAGDVDKRKSLIDMKAFVAPSEGDEREDIHDSTQIMTSRKVSVSQPETPPTLVRTGSEESEHSYTLGQKDQQPLPAKSPARRQHMTSASDGEKRETSNGIGMARTSDVVVPHTPSPSAEEQQARAQQDKRPSRIILGGTSLHNGDIVDSPTIKTESPQDFLASRSLAVKTDLAGTQQPSAREQMQAGGLPALKVAQKRRSIPGVAFTSAAQSPLVEKSQYRQSWSAALQQQKDLQDGNTRPVSVPSVPAVPTVPALHPSVPREEAPVQDSGLSQPTASSEAKDGEAARDVDEAVMTSASIRGPEDFDSFGQGGDAVGSTSAPERERERGRPQAPVELSSVPSFSRGRAGAPAVDPSDARTGRSPVSKQATSATPDTAQVSSPDQGQSQNEADALAKQAKKENRRSISRPPPRNTSVHRRSGLIAREPQVMTESTRDFADFIRSTGPGKEQGVTPLLTSANRSTTSLHSVNSVRSASIHGSRPVSVVSQERAHSMNRSTMESENVPPVPPVPSKTKGNMQPRGATGAGNGNTELIDFIRSGPDQPGQHRIPKSVAPFRSTMDSDQLNDMGDRINGGKPLPLSVNTNVSSAPSQPSARSVGSARSRKDSAPPRSAMANNASSNVNVSVHPAHSGQPQRLAPASTTLQAPGADPVRKRHRNKDPYAIDMDDDDDDDLLTALPKGKRQEESLVDFLNNTEPPKDNAPRPLVNGGGAQARSLMNKSRANSVNYSKPPSTDPGARTKSMQASTGPRPGNAPPGRTTPNGPQRPSPERNNSSAFPVMQQPKPKPKLEARGAGDASKDKDTSRLSAFHPKTNDLADFLKNSGPDDLQSAPAPSVSRQSKLSPKEQKKAEEKIKRSTTKKGGVSGFFSRRRKHIDML